MEEVFRSLVGRFNESVRSYLKPSRQSSRLPVQVTIQPKIQTTSSPKKNLSIAGETVDISENGISFIVPFIRLGEHYLVDADTQLSLEVELPNGLLNLQAVGCRYQLIGQDLSVGKYVVGAKFVEVDKKNRVLLTEYLEMKKGRGKNKVKNVEWGLDLSGS
jgi:hypothetical protein